MFIRNKHNNGYLMITDTYDGERNAIYAYPGIPSSDSFSLNIGIIGINIPIRSDVSPENAKWQLMSVANGQHQILNIKANEPLYAGDDHNAYDSERRRVFTWRTQDHDNRDWRNWMLEDAGDGYYKIKNMTYGEYLYVADHPSTGYVFTWRGQQVLNDKFLWQLINA